jgi:glycosyltransferase involved in cell wall biosynthesis
MNILVTMGLSDRTVLSHIYPLSLADEVNNIFIVRNTKGPEIEKVKYYCPPKWSLRFLPLTYVFKFLLLIFLSIKKNVSFIHSYLLFPHGYLALFAAKLTRKKAGVSLLAGPVEFYSFGGSPIGKYAYTKPLPKLHMIGKFSQKIINFFDIIVTAGSFSRNFLLDKGIAANKVTIIPYFVFGKDLKQINTEKKYDLIYVGRLVKVKHIENILYISEKLIHFYSFMKLKVAIVGDGPCSNELKNISEQLNIKTNIDFLGHVEDVGLFFSKSKLSIITSERETGPFSAIESMMCGVPVISSACGDTVNDIVTNGYNGHLIKNHGSIEDFAKQIRDLLKNPSKIDTYSENAIKTAQKIKIDKTTSEWKDVLDMLHKV